MAITFSSLPFSNDGNCRDVCFYLRMQKICKAKYFNCILDKAKTLSWTILYYDQSDHCNYCEVNVSVAKYEETIILKYYSINIRILVLKIIQNI